jgi:hypothetical protein
MVTTGSNALNLHVCDGCRDYVVPPCSDSPDGKHDWACFDHWGHPTGEQMCQNISSDTPCGELRHHPDERHSAGHFEGHRTWLEDGGECWCQGQGEGG